MDTRRRLAPTGALECTARSHAMRWAMTCAVGIALLAMPRPAVALDSPRGEDAAMAMVLLLSLGQALAQKSNPAAEPADADTAKGAAEKQAVVQAAAAPVETAVPAVIPAAASGAAAPEAGR